MKWIIAIALLFAANVFAQPNVPPDTLWTKAYGSSASEQAYGVCQAADGGLCIVGEYGPSPLMFAVRTNGSGDTLWTRRFTINTGRNVGHAVRPTADGGFVIGGVAPSSSQSSDFLVMKIDADGNIVWNVWLGGNSPGVCYALWVNQDGTILAAGSRASQGYVAKLTAGGDTLWTHEYGGAGNDRLSSISSTATGFILCGQMSVGDGNNNLWLLRITDSGDQVWSRNYGGVLSDDGYSAKSTADGGFVAAGFTASFGSGQDDYYMIRTNAQGDTLWTRIYGTTETDRCYSVQLASDGGYVLAGYSHGQNNGTTNHDVLFAKFTAQGALLWSKVEGETGNDFCRGMEKTQDGGFIAIGYTNSIGNGSFDFYAVRLAGVSGVGGFIRDEVTGLPIEGAIVQEVGNSLQAISDDLGHYILSVFPGVHDLIVYGQCVERDTVHNFTVIQDSIMELDFQIGLPEGNVPQTSINILAPNHSGASENLLIYNEGAGLLDWSLAVRAIEPPGTWLTASPMSGSVATGDSAVVIVTVRIDTANIGVFDLDGQIHVHMNTCPDSVIRVDVHAAIVNEAGELSPPLPDDLTLMAYPNPFNPQTTLEFSVPQAGPLTLIVYNMTGRRVMQLIEENIQPGTHRISFDGSVLASGIYFARIETTARMLTQKLLLLK